MSGREKDSVKVSICPYLKCKRRRPKIAHRLHFWTRNGYEFNDHNQKSDFNAYPISTLDFP